MPQDLSSRPSFFEVYAAQHLSEALRPAVRFVLDVLSVRNPRLLRAAAWSDEIFTAALLALESSHLRSHFALISESFYSLRRSAHGSFVTSNISEDSPSWAQVFRSIFFAVLLPHIKVKLDKWYSNATGGAAAALFQRDEPPLQSARNPQIAVSSELRAHARSTLNSSASRHTIFNSIRVLLRRLLLLLNRLYAHIRSPLFKANAIRWYPRICAGIEGVNLALNILYLYGHSKYFNLSLALQGLILRRTGMADLMRMAFTGFKSHEQTSSSSIYGTLVERLLGGLKWAFLASIFAFRFLQYYYAAEVRPAINALSCAHNYQSYC